MARPHNLRRAVRNSEMPILAVNTRLGGAASGAFTRGLLTLPFAAEIVGVDIMSSSALSAEAANYWTFTLQQGATVIATRDTDSAGGGAIAAETAVAMTLTSTLANLDAASGAQIDLVGTPATGSAADLSAVDLVVCVRYQPQD